MSVQARACDAANSGGRTPGSKLPASPPPLPHPDGGGTPGRVPVYTAKKANHQQTNSTCEAAQQGHRPLQRSPFNMNWKWLWLSAQKTPMQLNQHSACQTHPTSTRVQDVSDGVFSLHRLNAVPCKIVSTIRREIITTTRHRITEHLGTESN